MTFFSNDEYLVVDVAAYGARLDERKNVQVLAMQLRINRIFLQVPTSSDPIGNQWVWVRKGLCSSTDYSPLSEKIEI